MISAPTTLLPAAPSRTIWGYDAVQLHSRFWASFGVQVVRQGEPSEIVPHAELYLLTDPRSLPLFRMADVMNVLNWVGPQVLFVRVHDTRERTYRERAITDQHDRFLKFQRIYESADRLARVVLTPEREIAQLWMNSPDPVVGWRRLRRSVRRHERATVSANGNVFDRTSNEEIAGFVQALVSQWRSPDSTIRRVKPAPIKSPAKVAEAGATARAAAWIDPEATVDAGARLIGNVWVGAGRNIAAGQTLVGPAVVWDDPAARPQTEQLEWLTIEPTERADEPTPAQVTGGYRVAKRVFDLCFATAALIGTAPLWPVIMFLIWLEDGRPFFFAHRRESLNGVEFGCLKFRSMRKNAEAMVEQLKAKNKSDGAHVNIENDPRVTRIGHILRKSQLDELPQFLNVIAGHMSIVGPRPSPNKENQFAPAWREARLSVKPGITGLWQISRTRKAGSDFQEWIKYDLEYVEKCSLWLDIKIIWKTIEQILRRGSRS